MSIDGIEEEERIAQERIARAQADEQTTAIIGGSIQELALSDKIVALESTATVADAVKAMIDNRLGAVLIVENDRLLGLFTERDVLTRVVAHGLTTSDTLVAEVMTRDPECLSCEDGIVFALNKMTVGGFRHIPILDDTGAPASVLSMRDVVEHIVSFYSDEVFNLPGKPGDGLTSRREGA